ncbi:ATP-binding cassette sub-family C member 4-like [Bos taurus]|uniref:ATP-binding cassette sub-family C member 4-like n=1 Tax=Bos taurus TaxID=9913 RepID=UPI0028CB9994|nr:ATP-binding cassette sub-family C member 4-like [Bos taurus]
MFSVSLEKLDEHYTMRDGGRVKLNNGVFVLKDAVLGPQTENRLLCRLPHQPFQLIPTPNQYPAVLDLWGFLSHPCLYILVPLSQSQGAVYQHTEERCICQVLHEKIIILVTHQWQYLKDASQILLLEKGEMVQKGTYAELLKSGVDFASLLKKENEEAEPSPVPESPTIRTQTSSESSVQSQQSSTPLLKDAAAEDQDTENIQDTLSEERRLEGKVGFKTYKNYFRAGAHWSVIIFLILVNIAAQVAYILEDWWLLNWANEQHTLNITAHEKGNITEMLDLNWYLGIFSGLTVSTLIFGVTRSLLALYIFVNSSQTLHNKMLKTILRVPVLFFDRNPAGRILNRFSKDIGHMDDLLPASFQEFIQTFLQVIGVVVVVVVVIPWIAIPVIPLGIIFLILRRYFLETSRDVKRLECSTRSPVFYHLASSLQGLWTIRAYKAEQKFQELFDSHQDLHSDQPERIVDECFSAYLQEAVDRETPIKKKKQKGAKIVA